MYRKFVIHPHTIFKINKRRVPKEPKLMISLTKKTSATKILLKTDNA